jgi:predicted dithiol-disulfide oxidoreductase (DUF899 family)
MAATRKAHLKNEKALTRMRDLVAAERRTLPWVKVEKKYVFETPEGKRTLAELFDGRSQLIVYHFMCDGIWAKAAQVALFSPTMWMGPMFTWPITT